MTTITNLVRVNEKIVSYDEDGETFEIARNALGKPTSIQSKRGKWVEENSVFRYDSKGRFLGLTGDIETTLLPTLLAEAGGTATFATDASGNATGLVDPVGGVIPLTNQAALLTKPSKVQLDFTDPAIVWAYTSATGALDKSIQRFSNYTLRLDLSASSSQIRKGTNISITADPLDQLLSIDIYIPFMPISGGSGHSINVQLTNVTGYSANNHTYGFDSNYLRQGWNTLKMWAGDAAGASGTGTLAYGASKVIGGTGLDMTSTIGYVEITFNNMNGKSVYLDGVRRGAKSKTVLVMGFDATGTGTNDNVFTQKVAPLFAQYGYQGYFTVTNVYDLLYAGSNDDLRKRALYSTFGWDALNHTWNHGGTVPGGSSTVTGSATADLVTIAKTAHGNVIGSKWHAAISGATPAAANGVWEMTATTANAFTYTAAGAGTVALTGTVTYSTLLADVVPSASTLSTQIVNHELTDLAKVMRATGFNRSASIGAWPNNSVPDLTTTQTACTTAQISLFRGIKGGTVKINEFGVDNPLHFGSVEWGSGTTATTLQYVKDKLTGAIGRGEHMWTYGHYVLDDTNPANAAYFPVDNGLAPGAGSNPNPPAAGAQGGTGGWWYLSTINRFLAEAVAPAIAAGTLEVNRPSDWAKKIGAPIV